MFQLFWEKLKKLIPPGQIQGNTTLAIILFFGKVPSWNTLVYSLIKFFLSANKELFSALIIQLFDYLSQFTKQVPLQKPCFMIYTCVVMNHMHYLNNCSLEWWTLLFGEIKIIYFSLLAQSQCSRHIRYLYPANSKGRCFKEKVQKLLFISDSAL